MVEGRSGYSPSCSEASRQETPGSMVAGAWPRGRSVVTSVRQTAWSAADSFGDNNPVPFGIRDHALVVLLIIVALSVVDHIVKPEANVYLGWMFRQRDDVLDLLEALSKVLIRVVVAMWLGVPT